MADFASSKEVKTRKNHRCGMCGIIISKGSIVEMQSGCFEGIMYRFYLCEVCKEFIENNREDIDLDDSLDDIYDMMREQFEDEKCRKCQRWDDDANECGEYPCPENCCRCEKFTAKGA